MASIRRKKYNVKKTTQDRFEEKYIPEPMTGCWLWIGATNAIHYGKLHVDGKFKGAHVVAYELYRGDIPSNLVLDHLCRTPACVNPWHLEAITPRTNVLRSPQALAAQNARKTHCHRGHAFTEENTYRRKDRPNNRQCRQCVNDSWKRYRARNRTRQAWERYRTMT